MGETNFVSEERVFQTSQNLTKASQRIAQRSSLSGFFTTILCCGHHGLSFCKFSAFSLPQNWTVARYTRRIQMNLLAWATVYDTIHRFHFYDISLILCTTYSRIDGTNNAG